MENHDKVLSCTISRRRFLTLLGAGAGASLLAACQASPPAPAAPPAATTAPGAAAPKPATAPTAAPAAQPPAAASGGTLTIAVTFDPDTIDPPNITSPGPEQLAMLIHDRLTELAPDMSIKPGLAESWSSKDGVVWTFKLRSGVQFHDGQPVNAEAVKFNIDRIIDTKKPVKRAAYFAKVQSAKVVDASTVEITTNGPFGALPSLLATCAASIVSPKAATELGDSLGKKPVGSGIFSFQQWISGERVVLKRNDRHWAPPKLSEVVFRTVPEDSTRVAMLETGQVDVAQHIPPSEMKRLQGSSQLRIIKLSSLECRDIRFNVLDQRFKDVRVRQAMNYAINMPEVIDSILAGAGTYTGGPLPPQIFGAIKSTKYRYDVATAKKLLADAGYANGFKATLWGAKGTAAGLDEMLQALQAQWRAVGIDVTLDLREVAAFQALATKGPEEAESSGKQLISLGIGARYPDPDAALYAQFHSSQFSPKGTNRGFYKNPKVDELLDQGSRETDPAKREPIYRQVQEILVEDAPAIFLYVSDLIMGVSQKVKDIQFLPTQHMLLAATTKG